MKKRLRKKLHRGEFQEFGFGIAWHFTPVLEARSSDVFFNALIEMVAARGLTFGGGGGPEQGSGFICKARRGSASEEDRSQVAEWFRGSGPTVSATVGLLEDAWHSSPLQGTSVRGWAARGGEVIVMPPARE